MTTKLFIYAKFRHTILSLHALHLPGLPWSKALQSSNPITTLSSATCTLEQCSCRIPALTVRGFSSMDPINSASSLASSYTCINISSECLKQGYSIINLHICIINIHFSFLQFCCAFQWLQSRPHYFQTICWMILSHFLFLLFPFPMSSQLLHLRTSGDEASYMLSLQWLVLVQKATCMLHGPSSIVCGTSLSL